jgi:hypothetical protein
LPRPAPSTLLLSVLAGLAIPGPSWAQPAQPQSTQPASDPSAITGRDFAGLTLAAPPQSGEIRLQANRAAVWIEGTGVDATSPGTQRLFLRGDVRVNLGLFSFAAAQAVVWLERVGPVPAIDPAQPDKPAPPSVWQVAIYFDRVGEGAAEHGATQSGDRLLVTGVIRGELALRADALTQSRPDETLLTEGEARFGNYLRSLVAPQARPGDTTSIPLPPPVGIAPVEGLGPMRPGLMRPYEPNSPYARAPIPSPAQIASAQPAAPAEPTPIFTGRGSITIAAGEPTLIPGKGDEETVLQITGGVTVQYADPAANRSLQISAQRAIVYFAPGELTDLFRATEDRVLGIYVEGDVVATDGRFTLRGEQVFYDVKANRAYVADAVFWTYDQTRGMPLYVRAKALRQTAANQVEGDRVTLANSSFFTPHFSMGARTLTVTREEATADTPARTMVRGSDLTLQAGRLPFFYWPSFSGDADRFPLKEIGFENSSDSGAGIKTRWDIFGLVGQDAPPGTRFDLLLDAFLDRGIGLGTDSQWTNSNSKGEGLAYIVPDDDGRDTLSSGEKRERDNDTRGLLLGEHTWKLDRTWALQLEGSYASDENFVDAYYDTLAETRREFASSAYLKATDSNSLFGLLAKGSFNNFVINEYLLQSQGYSVDKLPEATYFRTADDPLWFVAPDWLNWSQEWRVGMMAFNLNEKTPGQHGYSTIPAANAAFGPGAFGIPGFAVGPNQRMDLALNNRGYREDSTARFDTRHDLSAPFKLGPVNFTPFAAGRFTMYDDRFNRFRSFVDPTNDDKMRGWYSTGLHVGTSIQRVDDSVESEFFDLHRIRHLFEPNASVWTAGTNIRREELPIYDEQVEGISEGTAFRIGAVNTWQTQRGGEGRWRTVDLLTLRTDYIYATNDTERKSPIQKFFDYRPEYSVFGEGFTTDAVWQATDATAFTVNYVYDLDRNQPARTTAGMKIDHTESFSTFIEAHYLNARDSTYVSFGGDFKLTDLYTFGLYATYDVDLERFQAIGGRINRELPSLILSVKLAYNDITDEFAAGVALQPTGRDRRREQLRRIGRDQVDVGQPSADFGTQSPESLLK